MVEYTIATFFIKVFFSAIIIMPESAYRVATGPGKTWKVLDFEKRPGKSLKVLEFSKF